MGKDLRYKKVPKAKRQRRSENESVSPSKLDVRQHPDARDRHTGKEEGRDAAEDGVGDGEEDSGDLA